MNLAPGSNWVHEWDQGEPSAKAQVLDNIDEARRRPGVPVASTVTEAADLIQGHAGGLGTTSLSVILSEKRPLKVLKLDGVEPSVEAIEEGQYRFIKSFNMIVAMNHSDTVQGFIDFIRSAPGESILKNNGHLVVPDSK